MSATFQEFLQLLESAIENQASDVHLKAYSTPAFRIHGNLHSIDTSPTSPEWIEELIPHILPDHFQPQLDSRSEVDFAWSTATQERFRINIFRQRGEWALALRHVQSKIPDFDSLHLSPAIQNLANYSNGIVLLAGATGQGKSTTLAALLQSINQARPCHIITLEDPIEFLFSDELARIEQREIGIDTPSFHEGLRSVLRQDPDVIMIGEMRDANSFQSAIHAAETGHLVFSTLHTSTPSEGIARILEFFPSQERDFIRLQLASNLRAIACQRLIQSTHEFRVPAIELLVNSPAVQSLIHKNDLKLLPDAIKAGAGEGQISFNRSLLQLHQDGLISKETALAASDHPQALQMEMQGIIIEENKRILRR